MYCVNIKGLFWWRQIIIILTQSRFRADIQWTFCCEVQIKYWWSAKTEWFQCMTCFFKIGSSVIKLRIAESPKVIYFWSLIDLIFLSEILLQLKKITTKKWFLVNHIKNTQMIELAGQIIKWICMLFSLLLFACLIFISSFI